MLEIPDDRRSRPAPCPWCGDVAASPPRREDQHSNPDCPKAKRWALRLKLEADAQERNKSE